MFTTACNIHSSGSLARCVPLLLTHIHTYIPTYTIIEILKILQLHINTEFLYYFYYIKQQCIYVLLSLHVNTVYLCLKSQVDKQ